MEPITAFARAHGLEVVEDAAQAHGAAYGGRAAGTLGRAAAFSFYPTKNLGALGDAGAVVTSDSELAERARLLRNYGERKRYESLLSGRNSRLDTVQAAVLHAKLVRLDDWNGRRRSLALRYLAALPEQLAELAAEAPGRRHSYHLFVVRTPERDRFRAELRERGVETLVHYPRAIHEHPAYRHLARPGALAAERAALPRGRQPAALPRATRRRGRRRGGRRRRLQPLMRQPDPYGEPGAGGCGAALPTTMRSVANFSSSGMM